MRAWFSIQIDGGNQVIGLYQAAGGGEHIPIHLEAIENLSANTDHVIAGVWKVELGQPGDQAHIGSSGGATLQVIIYPPGTTLS